MNEQQITDQLDDIQKQLALITEEMELRKRQRQDFEELKQDLTVVAKDVFSTAVVELEDISPFVRSGDFWNLLKHLLRNINLITEGISKVESMFDFAEDALPLGRDAFTDLLLWMEEMDRKGLFDTLKAVGKVMEDVAEHLPPEEIEKLSKEVVIPGIELLKQVRSLNLVPALGRTVQQFTEKGSDAFDSFNTWDAYKKSKKTEMRRALGRTIFFLETLARETNREIH